MTSDDPRRTEFLRSIQLSRRRDNAGGHANLGLIEGMATKRFEPFGRAMTGGYFQAMRELNYPLRQLVNKRVLGIKWILNHATILTYFTLMDLLGEEQLSEKALEQASRTLPPDLKKSVSPRQLRRLANLHYRNVVQTVVVPSPETQRLMDDPKYIVWGPPRPTKPIAEKDDRIRLMKTNYSSKSIRDISFLSPDMVDPSYLELFHAYWTSVLRLLPAIRSRGLLRKQSIWVLERFIAGDYVAHVLFQDFMEEVYRQWFEGSLGGPAKVQLLDPVSWPQYSAEDAAKAIEQYHSLLSALEAQRDPAQQIGKSDLEHIILDEISIGAVGQMQRAVDQRQRPTAMRIGRWLFDECLRQELFATEPARSACEHNLAVAMLLDGDSSKASLTLAPAIEYWQRTGDTIRLIIDSVLRDMTAGETQLGKANVRRIRVLKLLDSLSPQERARTCLELCDIAAAKGDREVEETFMSKGLKCSFSDGLDDYADYFTQRSGSFGKCSIRIFPTNLQAETSDIPGKCYEERRLNGLYLSFCGGFPHLH